MTKNKTKFHFIVHWDSEYKNYVVYRLAEDKTSIKDGLFVCSFDNELDAFYAANQFQSFTEQGVIEWKK